ncbi:hypothetical protein U1Q18_012015, partial [Sarracenia purpurea var. burkii]
KAISTFRFIWGYLQMVHIGAFLPLWWDWSIKLGNASMFGMVLAHGTSGYALSDVRGPDT